MRSVNIIFKFFKTVNKLSKTTCIVTRVRVNILHSSYFFLLQKKQQKRLSTIQLRELLSKHISRSH